MHVTKILFPISEHLTKLFNLLAAISTVVTIAEILKNNGLAVEKSKDFWFLFLIKYACNYITTPR